MLSVDWPSGVINVPQSYLTFVGGSVYELDTYNFHLDLLALGHSVQGRAWPRTHKHNTSVLLGGVEYARIIEIINGYTVTFEDGSYVVNLIGSNNNILDVTNLNQVQIRSNNSAGLINVKEIQQDIFGGGVWVDQAGGTAGQLYPIGTPLRPVNNFPDAVVIANTRGLTTLFIKGNAILDTGDDVSGFRIIGENASRTQLTLNAGANAAGCDIQEAYVSGNLDGGSIMRNCVISNLNYINGFVFQCMLEANTNISLGGTYPAHFLNCFSGTPGVGTATIDCNGVTDDQDTPLAFRGYSGGIKLIDLNGGASVSVDFSSGQLIIDTATCTNGTVVARGNGKVVDQNGANIETGTYGDFVIYNETAPALAGVSGGGLTEEDRTKLVELWQLQGLDAANPLAVTATTRTAGSISQTITGDGQTSSTVTRTP